MSVALFGVQFLQETALFGVQFPFSLFFGTGALPFPGGDCILDHAICVCRKGSVWAWV